MAISYVFLLVHPNMHKRSLLHKSISYMKSENTIEDQRHKDFHMNSLSHMGVRVQKIRYICSAETLASAHSET